MNKKMLIRLEEIVGLWKLTNHPFYKAWSDGLLSKEALRDYAVEYGSFINLIPMGWRVLGDDKNALEEIEHARMWEDFSQSLGESVDKRSELDKTNLERMAEKLFNDKASALGALYAFECQQPETAESKLRGLHEHYTEWNIDDEYFAIHRENQHEATKLLSEIEKFPDHDLQTALLSCSQMCEALWQSLSAVYSRIPPMAQA